jgi:ERCC4-type nuclease
MEEEKSKNLPVLLIDSREQLPYVFRASENLAGTEVAGLKVGDYSIRGFEHMLFIERKSLNDLYGSLGSGRERFERELEKAKDIPYKFLIIEATLQEVLSGFRYHDSHGRNHRSKLSPNFILSSLISMMIKKQIYVLFGGDRDSCRTIVRNIVTKIHKYIINNEIPVLEKKLDGPKKE